MSNLIKQKVIDKIGNRFDLVLVVACRARQIQIFSKELSYDEKDNNDKPTIIALKEIENNLDKIDLSSFLF